MSIAQSALLVPLWALLGAAAGALIRGGSLRLARREDLEPGRRLWQRAGPPLLCGLLFGVFAWRIGPGPVLLIRSLWVAILVQVIFFDLEHHLILDVVLLPASALALLLSIWTPHLGWKAALLGGLGAGLAFLLIALVGAAIFRAEALGMGDVKFSVFIGLAVGLQQILTAVLLGVLLAGLASILLIVLRIRGMRDAIAYGPFLAAGTLIILYRLGAH